LYKKFRNPDTKVSGHAMAQAFKIAFAELYARNEYWHTLNKTDLKNFLVEVLEVESDNVALSYLIRTIETLKKYANFENTIADDQAKDLAGNDEDNAVMEHKEESGRKRRTGELAGINLSYTINLNLPESSDIKVFDAIFKSLKENLLKNEIRY
jgi:hypothetical protein